MTGFLAALVISMVAVPTASATKRYCSPVKLPGFTYKSTVSNKDIYRHSNGIRMEVRCPPATITADDLINKYKTESSVRNTLGDAVYFEFDRERMFERIYVITRRPTVELIFSIHYKKRARLNGTEPAVVAAYPKLK